MNFFLDSSHQLRPGFRVLAFYFFVLVVLAIVQTVVKLGGVAEGAVYQATVYPIEALGILSISALAFRLFEGQSTRPLGFRNPRAMGLAAVFFVAGILTSGAVFAGVWISTLHTVKLEFHPEALETPSFLPGLVIFSFAGAAEEMAFRGYPFLALQKSLGRWGATVCLSMLFVGVHPNLLRFPAAILSIFLAGIFLTQLFVLSGSLWLPVGFHFGWNLSQALIFPFSTQNATLIGVGGVEASARGLTAGAEQSWGTVFIFFLLTVAAETLLIRGQRQLDKEGTMK